MKINVELTLQPMTLFEYKEKYTPDDVNHLENKWIKGYICTLSDYIFWINQDMYNKIIRDNDLLCKQCTSIIQ